MPFPILRLGNAEKTAEALRTIAKLYDQCIQLPVPEKLLDKNHADRTARAKQLTELLERYERVLDLRERKETIERLLEARSQMNFRFELEAGQLPQVNRELAAYGDISLRWAPSPCAPGPSTPSSRWKSGCPRGGSSR